MLKKSKVTKNVKYKRRKQLTDQQKQALRERLAIAREAKLKKQKPKNLHLHESIRDLPDSHPLNPKKVQSWIKINNEILKASKALRDSKVSSDRAKYRSVEAYLGACKQYLTNGTWTHSRMGPQMEWEALYESVAMSYYPNGVAKRTVGVFYPDIDKTWTQEDDVELRKSLPVFKKKKK